MAGQIVVSSIKTDSDNSISFLANTGATIFSANLASGLSASSFGNNTITSDKIVSVANTQITGNITSSQITSVANTQLTGTVTNAQVDSSVYEGIGFRNRIINGDMRIAQRGTAAVTTNADYIIDRFFLGFGFDGACSAQQDSSAPTGFVNSIKFTTTTADASLTGTQNVIIFHRIEGTNIADLGWGTANAKTVTLSFFVRSSLTGTFGGSLKNSAANRSYPFTYSISVADTFEYKTIEIEGDTSGTWLTDNGIGIGVQFSMGAGPDRSGTADAWNSNNNNSATGAVSVIGTLNATWFVTGVQLEVGAVATPFERRPFGTEFILCQRYFQKYISPAGNGIFNSTTSIARCAVGTQVQFRATPTVSISGTLGCYDGSATGTITAFSATYAGVNTMEFDATVATGTFTANRIARLYIAETGTINGSAEL